MEFLNDHKINFDPKSVFNTKVKSPESINLINNSSLAMIEDKIEKLKEIKSDDKIKHKKESKRKSRSCSRSRRKSKDENSKFKHKKSSHKHRQRSRSKSSKERKKKSYKHKKHKRSSSKLKKSASSSMLKLNHITMSKHMDKIIDKKRLLKIAENSLEIVNTDLHLNSTSKHNQIKINHFIPKKKSINEFVDLCKNLSNSMNDNTELNSSNIKYSSLSNNTTESINTRLNFYNIRMNNDEAVTKLFPVSSGTQHRIVENENKDKIDTQVFVRTSENLKSELTDSNYQNELEKIEINEEPRYKKLNSEEILQIQANKNLGKFTGLTDAKLLTPEELEGQTKAWTRKDLLIKAAPITDSVGKKLLEKMGWKEGQGLGKKREGLVEPIKLGIKIDRKGLVSENENKIKDSVILKQCDGKHPVSSLLELCKAKKWPEPIFEVVEESGPAHLRNFLLKVTLNNVSYQPTSSSTNKKLAKANAAFVCLQALGFVCEPPN